MGILHYDKMVEVLKVSRPRSIIHHEANVSVLTICLLYYKKFRINENFSLFLFALNTISLHLELKDRRRAYST